MLKSVKNVKRKNELLMDTNAHAIFYISYFDHFFVDLLLHFFDGYGRGLKESEKSIAPFGLSKKPHLRPPEHMVSRFQS